MKADEGTWAAVHTDTGQFVNRLTDAIGRAPGPAFPLLRPLLELLVSGEPVAVERLAASTGRPVEETRRALAAMPDTEYDPQGRIVGFGLTCNPTPHHYEAHGAHGTHGRALYTWCAMDALVFPAILGASADVESTCPATGQPVRLTATPDGPVGVEPAGAVVSLVVPEESVSLRSSFCERSHFFAGAQAAREWFPETADVRVLPVAEAHEAGRPLVERVLSDEASSSQD